MGVRGPLKLPKHLTAVPDRPNTGGDTLADRTRPSAPPKPAGWSDEDNATLSALWDEVTGQLDAVGLLAQCDGLTLELALRHFLAARQASDALADSDVIVKDTAHGGGPKKNPAGAEMRSQSLAFLEYAKQLGMSFVARARIPAKDDDDGSANPFAAPTR